MRLKSLINSFVIKTLYSAIVMCNLTLRTLRARVSRITDALVARGLVMAHSMLTWLTLAVVNCCQKLQILVNILIELMIIYETVPG